MRYLLSRPIALLVVTAAVFETAVHLRSSSLAPHEELPRIHLIATGGSISVRSQGPRLSAEDLVHSVPALDRYVRPEWEQFSNVASTALTLEEWLQLARRINGLFSSDAAPDGVVVATGTDTLEELAYFLHLTVKDPRPVVLVGSMRTPGSAGYDGPANLLSAFRTAADAGASGKGVLVVMHDDIHSAREVVKTDAQRLDAFKSRHGAIGLVDPEHVRFVRAPVRRHTTHSEFDLDLIAALPRVDILLFYQGATPDLVQAAIDLGAQGLVLAVAGADTTAGSLAAGLEYAARQGVPVVLSTRTGSGRIAAPAGNAAWRDYVAAEDLPPLKARVLLSLALTQGATPDQIQRMFLEY